MSSLPLITLLKPTKETKTDVINVERINEKVDLDKVGNVVAYGILFRSMVTKHAMDNLLFRTEKC